MRRYLRARAGVWLLHAVYAVGPATASDGRTLTLPRIRQCPSRTD